MVSSDVDRGSYSWFGVLHTFRTNRAATSRKRDGDFLRISDSGGNHGDLAGIEAPRRTSLRHRMGGSFVFGQRLYASRPGTAVAARKNKSPTFTWTYNACRRRSDYARDVGRPEVSKASYDVGDLFQHGGRDAWCGPVFVFVARFEGCVAVDQAAGG